jgi:ATP synthase protein I
MTNELAQFRRLILILSCWILAVLILLWFITPAKSFVAGFILGGLISLYNVLYLARRVRIVGQFAVAGSRRIVGTGFVNRILIVVFGIILAYRFPEWIDYRSLVFGLLISYVVMVVVACLYANKENAQQERRDILGNNTDN